MVAQIAGRETPVIVYCDSVLRQHLAQTFSGPDHTVYLNNCSTNGVKLASDVLENLGDLSKHPYDKHPILLIDDPQFMRGYNYRSGVGISLFLCRGFKTARDVLQAKGRVGRYGDQCTRFKTVQSLEDTCLKREYLRTL